ncbi:MAG: RHS repeat-associated core domain-containing protein [Gammaproteobacteria bacterium]|nr:RHS repeat-associated core domain-containing protein [Gammaproteobacteria bacterium]
MEAEPASGQSVQRYYDPQIGRFLSVDPVTAYSNPVAGFNRYRYAANNPYKFIDPDGQADIVFFQRDEGLAVTARRFDIPGWFTAMGHAGVIPGDPDLKFRDDRMSDKIFTGERLTVNRLVEEIRLGGFDAKNDRGVFLGQCSVGGLAIDAARQLGVPVMASEGFVRTVPNNTSGPITYTSNSERDGSGKAMTFNVYTPDGNISRSYSSITMRADGSVWGRQATPETGTRIRKEEKIK